MPELYENEPFVNNKIPIRIFNHSFDGESIFTVTHWHRNIEFNMVTAGRIQRVVDGQNIDQFPGDIVIVNSGLLHADHWIEPNDHFEGITVQISKSFIDYWIGKDAWFQMPDDPEAVQTLRKFLSLFGDIKRQKDTLEDPLQLDLLKYRTMQLLFQLLSLLRVSFLTKNQKVNERTLKSVGAVKDIINYIDQHYTENLSLSQVAEEFHYTPAHLSRLFKEHIGTKFHDYLQHVRLMNCVEVMKQQPDIQLTSCALNHGFPNIKSFIETFKRYFGCTPSVWLKNRSQ